MLDRGPGDLSFRGGILNSVIAEFRYWLCSRKRCDEKILSILRYFTSHLNVWFKYMYKIERNVYSYEQKT